MFVARLKCAQFDKKKAESENALNAFRKRVGVLEASKVQLLSEVDELTRNLHDTRANYDHIERNIETTIGQVLEQRESHSTHYKVNLDKLNEVKRHMVEMRDKMVQVAESQRMMLKAIDKMTEDCQLLKYTSSFS